MSEQLNGKDDIEPCGRAAQAAQQVVLHPKVYDIKVDRHRRVTQADFDAARDGAESDFIRKLLFKRLLGADLGKLRAVRKLIDDSGLFRDQDQ